MSNTEVVFVCGTVFNARLTYSSSTH